MVNEDDVSNGLIFHVGDVDQHSPTAQLTRLLDETTDALMDGSAKAAGEFDYQRGRAVGLAEALSRITCYSVDQVRRQIMLRWEERKDQ